MRYINFNEEDFIKWLQIEKGILVEDLEDHFNDYYVYLKKVFPISLNEIKLLIESVSKCNDISIGSRKRHYVYLRSVYYLLSKKYTTFSLFKIGKEVKKDHASVIHNLELIEYNLNKDYFDEYKEIYDVCDEYLKQRKRNILLYKENSL